MINNDVINHLDLLGLKKKCDGPDCKIKDWIKDTLKPALEELPKAGKMIKIINKIGGDVAGMAAVKCDCDDFVASKTHGSCLSCCMAILNLGKMGGAGAGCVDSCMDLPTY